MKQSGKSRSIQQCKKQFAQDNRLGRIGLVSYLVLKEGKPMDPVFKVAFQATIGALIIVAIAMLFTGCTNKQESFLDEPDVKVVASNGGHGSGFMISRGLVITADHVVDHKDTTFTIKTQTGRIYKAEVLWRNEALDIAALWVEKAEIKSAHIRCSGPIIDELLVIKGHPFELEYIETKGRVAGVQRTVSRWKTGFVMDATIGPGMSGGGVYSEYGEVIGVAVGVRIHQIGLAGGPSGFSLAVPSSEVCKLIGR